MAAAIPKMPHLHLPQCVKPSLVVFVVAMRNRHFGNEEAIAIERVISHNQASLWPRMIRCVYGIRNKSCRTKASTLEKHPAASLA